MLHNTSFHTYLFFTPIKGRAFMFAENNFNVINQTQYSEFCQKPHLINWYIEVRLYIDYQIPFRRGPSASVCVFPPCCTSNRPCHCQAEGGVALLIPLLRATHYPLHSELHSWRITCHESGRSSRPFWVKREGCLDTWATWGNTA